MNTHIILGIFCFDFYKQAQELKAEEFDYMWVCKGLITEKEWEENDIIDSVKSACEKAEKIHFRLDDILLPLDTKSVTCEELILILKNKTFFNKTVFYLNNEIISNDLVLTKLRKKIRKNKKIDEVLI